ncbi:MAG: hypothetical protein HYT86_00035 [candidate division NC10 bacterium]|nr:hypothetical protein [candidate division NC10 bacterium]
MVPGFNSEVQHRGRRYHIQTEDLGSENPCLLTLVYESGAILGRLKVPYAEILGPQASAEQIRAFMEARHRQVIADLLADRLTAGSPPARTLEDLIAEALPAPGDGAAGARPGGAGPSGEGGTGRREAGGT